MIKQLLQNRSTSNFHIKYTLPGGGTNGGIILTNGKNEANNSAGKIVIDFEELYEGNTFKITPYQSTFDNDYQGIAYIFQNTGYFNDTAAAHIVVQLSTENGSISIQGRLPMFMLDGDPKFSL